METPPPLGVGLEWALLDTGVSSSRSRGARDLIRPVRIAAATHIPLIRNRIAIQGGHPEWENEAT